LKEKCFQRIVFPFQFLRFCGGYSSRDVLKIHWDSFQCFASFSNSLDMLSEQQQVHQSRRRFTTEEDVRLLALKSSRPTASWDTIAQEMGDRCARQCRERYMNYLAPHLRCGPWSPIEDRLLLEKINEVGHLWSLICRSFAGRSENDVKNRWHTHLKRWTVKDASGRYSFCPPVQPPNAVESLPVEIPMPAVDPRQPDPEEFSIVDEWDPQLFSELVDEAGQYLSSQFEFTYEAQSYIP
jgi:hypothetical protein